MEETNKRQIRFDLKKKILMLGVLPVLVLGLMVIFIAQTIVRDSLLKEIKDALQSAATSTFAAYDQNSGDYIKTENGEIWKGSYNISKSESLVDSIKEKTGLEVTFFYGKDRIMTSAKDKNGDRILGSPAGETIQKEVLEKGKEYFSDSVSIDGTLHYGYYVPVYQGDSKKPVGMIFVGANKAQKDSAINKIINTVILVVLIVMLLCIAVAAVFAFNFSGALKKGINMVQSVSSGNLKNEMDTKLIKRQDELGDLSKAISSLQEEMIKSIANIAGNAEAVLMASGELGETARETTTSMRQVEGAIDSIMQSAATQAEISDKAAKNVHSMGEKIERTTEEMEQMQQNADAMSCAEKQNVETIRELLESNKEVQELIQEIEAQTAKTNESVVQIKEATEIIASIASQTNLLSLNASIEAARAGESGKGFAVVATEIQQLASKSNESSQNISDILQQLTENSDRAVETMGKVTTKIEAQTEHIKETETMTEAVMKRILESIEGMQVIADSVEYLDGARKEIVETVSELSEIAKQNAATTQEVCTAANTVTENFDIVSGSMEGLKNIADELEGSMKHFQV